MNADICGLVVAIGPGGRERVVVITRDTITQRMLPVEISAAFLAAVTIRDEQRDTEHEAEQ